MRDFNFNDTPRITEASIAGARPSVLEPEQDTLLLVDRQDEAFRPPSYTQIDEDKSGNNTAKIVGGVIMGLLIVGGGIYAYETSSATTPQQQVALKTPASNHSALDQVAQPAPTPQPSMTPDTTVTPAATTPVQPRATRPAVRAADNTDADVANANTQSADSTSQSATTDQALNAPMTLAPDSAPPAQQPASQTAMQQPVTPPDVSGQTTQPLPAIANNDTPVVTPPAAQQTLAQTPTGQLPADQANQPSAQ